VVDQADRPWKDQPIGRRRGNGAMSRRGPGRLIQPIIIISTLIHIPINPLARSAFTIPNSMLYLSLAILNLVVVLFAVLGLHDLMNLHTKEDMGYTERGMTTNSSDRRGSDI
jgi:hypothetical protein